MAEKIGILARAAVRSAREVMRRHSVDFTLLRTVNRVGRTHQDWPERMLLKHRRTETLPRQTAFKTLDESELPEQREFSPGRRLAADVRSKLRSFVGASAADLVTHEGPNAGVFASSHKAEAVTVGNHVFFGGDPDFRSNRDDFALLVHEAMHVRAAAQPNAALHRSTHVGLAREEHSAQSQERTTLRRSLNRARQVDQSPAGAVGVRSRQATSSETKPMTAALDRAPLSAAPERGAPELDIEELRRTIHEDLIKQIRTDFERGA